MRLVEYYKCFEVLEEKLYYVQQVVEIRSEEIGKVLKRFMFFKMQLLI